MKSETAIQRAVVQTARRCGLLVFRMNAGKVKAKGGWVQLAPPGTPDVLCFTALGAVIWIETKTVIGKLSPEQRAMHTCLRARGHTVVVACSVDDVLASFGAAV